MMGMSDRPFQSPSALSFTKMPHPRHPPVKPTGYSEDALEKLTELK